ncbi:hypothetical protein WMW72_25220 [Paenibacillus filicis]|uniref:Uncharacterized protein n=1 Tax=Paenibacillus filicis TaxID=669464 RepID=A0ABU9DQT0_9BACL
MMKSILNQARVEANRSDSQRTVKPVQGKRSCDVLTGTATEQRQPQQAAPTIIWESRRSGGSSQEITIQEIHIGGENGDQDGPIIRVTSSGFGQKTAEARGSLQAGLRCAA